jgi:voltage-gated potassium channel
VKIFGINRPVINLKLDLILVTIFVFVWIIAATSVYYYLENWNLIDSFYFSVVTLTTVGYGEMYPTTTPSKLFTAFYSLSGVFLFLSAVTILGSHIIKKDQ